MTEAIRSLEAGDFVRIDFDPVRGSEQGGWRPAIVVSERSLHAETRRAIVCPCTRNIDPWPTKVMIPLGLAVEGAVLTDQVRSVDRLTRGFHHLGRATPDLLWEVRGYVARLLNLDPGPPP